MKGARKVVSCILMVSLIEGCAVSSTRMINEGNELSDTRFCRNFLNDYSDLITKVSDETITAEEISYLLALNGQRNKRGLDEEDCKALVKSGNTKVTIGIALGVLAVIAAAAAAQSGAVGSSSGYAWDQFYDEHGNLTWRCRNKSNGEFAYDFNCSSALKSDNTWPAK